MLTEGLSYALFIFASMRLRTYPKVLEWSDLLGFLSLSSLPPMHSSGFFPLSLRRTCLKYLFLQFLV